MRMVEGAEPWGAKPGPGPPIGADAGIAPAAVVLLLEVVTAAGAGELPALGGGELSSKGGCVIGSPAVGGVWLTISGVIICRF